MYRTLKYIFAALMLAGQAPSYADERDRFFDDRVYEWNENADDLCAKMDGAAPNKEIAARAGETFDIIRSSEAGEFLLDFAEEKGVVYCYNPVDYGGVVGTYISSAKVFTVAEDEPQADEIKISTHELRHMWQQENGYSISSFYKPKDMILIGKFMEADAEAYANLVVYEMEQAGHHIFSDVSEQKTYSAVHDAFSEYADVDLNLAMRAAFDAWFSTDVSKSFYERGYIDSVEGIIERSPVHYPRSYAFKEFSQEAMEFIGTLPDGRNYLVETGGVDASLSMYSDLASEENELRVSNAINRTESKRFEFCASRPFSDAALCAPYPVRAVSFPSGSISHTPG
jgi:hypothetical protein